jgi:FkbM family methyltransferase
MNYENRKLIYRKLTKKGFMPTHIAEVGVYYPETANLYDFIMDGVRATLVEPDPNSITRIKAYFKDKPNVTLHEVAIYERSGKITLAQLEASTFVSELEYSPAIVNDNVTRNAHDVIEVEAKTFDEVDDGSIDLLSVDIEGSEWFVIQNLVSKPAVISLETHGAMYTNPKLQQLDAWLTANDYIPWYKDRSDTVYVKKGSIAITPLDRLGLVLCQIYLYFRKKRKSMKRKLKSIFKT